MVIVICAGCSTNLDDYHSTQPKFVLEQFFNGKLQAYGTFQDRSGKVTRRFRVDMTASWDGDHGVLDEDFYYDDGEQQKRVWYLTKLSDGRYEGRADDIVGKAKGEVRGFALNWRYTMALTVDETTYHVNFDDWMYLVDETHLINRALVSKWGVTVGEVTLFIHQCGQSGCAD
jgi:hypothetical protein